MKINITIIFSFFLIQVIGCSPVLSFNDEHIEEIENTITAESVKREVVVIAGITYDVPDQWEKRRLEIPVIYMRDLEAIPTEYGHQGSKLYLLKEARRYLQLMVEAAQKDDIFLTVHSSYRTVWYQKKIFERLMESGRTYEDVVRYVAPPGYSEHALGTVVDFYPSNWQFASTEQYQWLKENAHKFHFSESYPEDNPENMPWEAWHWRWRSPTD